MSTWTEFVKEYRSEHPHVTYGQALVACSSLWEQRKALGDVPEVKSTPKEKEKEKEKEVMAGKPQPSHKKARSTRKEKLKKDLEANQRRMKLLQLEEERMKLELGEDSE